MILLHTETKRKDQTKFATPSPPLPQCSLGHLVATSLLMAWAKICFLSLFFSFEIKDIGTGYEILSSVRSSFFTMCFWLSCSIPKSSGLLLSFHRIRSLTFSCSNPFSSGLVLCFLHQLLEVPLLNSCLFCKFRPWHLFQYRLPFPSSSSFWKVLKKIGPGSLLWALWIWFWWTIKLKG